MNFKKLTFCLAALLICGCLTTHGDGLVPEVRSPVLIVLHDVSKTYDYIPEPNEITLRQLAELTARHGGQVAFGLIGSPDTVGHLIRKEFVAQPVLPDFPTYLDKIEYDSLLAVARALNETSIEEFVSESMTLIRQSKLHQHTDINGRFRAVRTYIEEPGMAGFQPIVYLQCDGKQDVKIRNRPVDTLLQPELLPANVRVLTCGWEHPTHPAGWMRIETPNGLISSLEFIITKPYHYERDN